MFAAKRKVESISSVSPLIEECASSSRYLWGYASSKVLKDEAIKQVAVLQEKYDEDHQLRDIYISKTIKKKGTLY